MTKSYNAVKFIEIGKIIRQFNIAFTFVLSYQIKNSILLQKKDAAIP